MRTKTQQVQGFAAIDKVVRDMQAGERVPAEDVRIMYTPNGIIVTAVWFTQ